MKTNEKEDRKNQNQSGFGLWDFVTNPLSLDLHNSVGNSKENGKTFFSVTVT